jgi:hypothetical protein
MGVFYCVDMGGTAGGTGEYSLLKNHSGKATGKLCQYVRYFWMEEKAASHQVPCVKLIYSPHPHHEAAVITTILQNQRHREARTLVKLTQHVSAEGGIHVWAA